MIRYVIFALKGIAMGAANVIPGVSGGTIALITGIFERIIHSIKSFNIQALRYIFKGAFRQFFQHTDFFFLITVLSGIAIAIISLARLLGYLFEHFPILVWAYFFGLILASVYFIALRISKWNWSVVLFALIGLAAALFITLLKPATENDSFFYLIICGAVASCSMILPGLSGSFVLILMGNYQLVMIDAINEMNLTVLIPVVLGAAAGLILFSYVLSWVFKKFKDQTIALLTGFILGSLSILWPWKETISTFLDRHGETQPLQQRNILPGTYHELTGEPSFLAGALLLLLIGIASIWLMEKAAKKQVQ